MTTKQTLADLSARVCLGASLAFGGTLYDQVVGAVTGLAARLSVAAIPGLSVASIETSSGTMTFRDLRLTAPDGQMKIGKAVARRPWPWGFGMITEASAATASLTLGDVSFSLGDLSVVIPQMEVKGSPLSAADFARIFEPGTSDSLLDRLARLNAAEVKAGEVNLSRTGGMGGDKALGVTLRNVALNNLVAGHIGALKVLQTTTADGASDTGSTVTTGKITVTDFDLPLLVKIATASRSDPAAAVQTVVRDFLVETVSIKAADGKMAMGSLGGSAIRGRPLLTTPDDLAALTDKPASARSEAEVRRLSDTLADMIAGFSIERLEAKDIAFRAGTPATSFDLGRLIFEGLEPGKLKLAAAERFSLSTQPATVAFNRLSLEGYDQTRLLDAVKAKGLSASSGSLDGDVGQLTPTFAGISLQSMRIDVAADDGKGNAEHGERNIVEVPAVELQLTHAAETGIASAAHVRFLYDIAADAPDPNLQSLTEAGFSRFDVNLDYAAGWNAAGRSASLDRFVVAARGFGSLAFSAAFGNVAPPRVDAVEAEASAKAAREVELRAARVEIEDRGLGAKAWSIMAKRAGVSVPLLKAEAKGQVQVALLKAFGNTPTAARLTEAISTFIDASKTLSVSLKAPPGLTLEAIGTSADPRAVLNGLEFSAEATR